MSLPLTHTPHSPTHLPPHRYLNGRGVGARYDGSFGQDSYYIGSCNGKTGSGNNFSQTYKNYLRDMFQTSINTWEAGSGWFFWTWKT